ncbi:ribosome biogenesis protein BRX1 homolog [Brevipalpus obovatus]|uniref:ribosome biogenesis protein BRX1 homolog n=1 Tax=Brevipalpus obovatus TaxID=246614 RepID=UPI003D9E1ACF
MGKRKRNSASNSGETKVSGKKVTNGSTVADNNKDDEKDYMFSDEVGSIRKSKWINRQRVMILAARGITARDRHMMLDLKNLLVHSKGEPKLDSEKKDLFNDVNEICEARNCNKCILFVNKKRKDSYLWVSNVPDGPSVKFFVENIHTMKELNMIGNCLKGSRPLLSFDPQFDSSPHMILIKELITQVFGIPRYHPKSMPFFDKVYTFTIIDKRIWFRNFQLISEEGKLEEIGPRFILSVIKIFSGSFSGSVLYSNPNFVNPNVRRRLIRQSTSGKYRDKIMIREGRDAKKPRGEEYQDIDPLEKVFATIPPEKAKGAEKVVFHRIRT